MSATHHPSSSRTGGGGGAGGGGGSGKSHAQPPAAASSFSLQEEDRNSRAALEAQIRRQNHGRRVSSISSCMTEVEYLLRQVQSIESSTWMCLMQDSPPIGKLLEKDEGGVLQLKRKYAHSPTFNIEDVMTAMDMYRNEVCVFCVSSGLFFPCVCWKIFFGVCDA